MFAEYCEATEEFKTLSLSASQTFEFTVGNERGNNYCNSCFYTVGVSKGNLNVSNEYYWKDFNFSFPVRCGHETLIAIKYGIYVVNGEWQLGTCDSYPVRNFISLDFCRTPSLFWCAAALIIWANRMRWILLKIFNVIFLGGSHLSYTWLKRIIVSGTHFFNISPQCTCQWSFYQSLAWPRSPTVQPENSREKKVQCENTE